MQKGADRLFLVEALLGGKAEHIDAAQVPVGAFVHQRCNGGNDLRIGGGPQGVEQGFGVAHDAKSRPKTFLRQTTSP